MKQKSYKRVDPWSGEIKRDGFTKRWAEKKGWSLMGVPLSHINSVGTLSSDVSLKCPLLAESIN